MSLFSSIGNSLGFGKGGSGRYDDALNLYDQIDEPTVEDLKIKLKQYVQAGILKPEQAQVILQDPSKFNDIATNPSFDEAELGALDKLQEIGDQGGLTAVDEGRLSDISRQENQQERGSREAILQNANQRGVGGSGFELMAQLMNQQGSAERKSARDSDVAGMAEQRALDAIINSGKLASDLESQDFNKAAQIAQANDEIERFNTTNRMNVGNANVADRNTAQQYNLENRQKTNNANVDLYNQQHTYNRTLPQKIYENKMGMAGKKAGILTGQGKIQNEQDKDVMANWGNIAKGAAAFI